MHGFLTKFFVPFSASECPIGSIQRVQAISFQRERGIFLYSKLSISHEGQIFRI